MKCPFCNEDDFDDVGLKMHLTRFWCEAFNKVPNEAPKTMRALSGSPDGKEQK